MSTRGFRYTIAPLTTITTAVTGVILATCPDVLPGANSISLESSMLVGTGGSTIKVWIQTSIDGGATWFDIANFAYVNTAGRKLSTVQMFPSTPFTAGTAPTDATLADNTVLTGIIGDRFRSKMTTTGTYSGGTSIQVDMVVKP